MNVLHDWTLELSQELRGLEKRNRLRSLQFVNGIDFSSNDYLGLNRSGQLKKIIQESLSLVERIGSTGSRLVSGEHPAFAEAESFFADLVGAPSGLLFHSGYAANLGALPALISRRDLVFCDRLCHASLLDGVRLSGARRYYFRHNDLEDLQTQLRKHPTGRAGRRWVVTESVFSMDGDSPDLQELVSVCEDEGCQLYIDEAHAIGLFGANGGGRVLEAGLQDRVAVRVFPCGKAPGLMGAFVAGPAPLREYLVNKARSLIYSTAQPPFLALALKRVLELFLEPEMETMRRGLRAKAEFLRQELRRIGYDTLDSQSQIVPVILGDDQKALSCMIRAQNEGLFLKAIRPPTVPEGQSRIRICLHSTHSDRDLERLLALFREIREKRT